MTNIIEKLARAIADAYDDDEQFERDGWLHPARAILQTLHDNITPEMVEAGWSEIEYRGCKRSDAVETFQAMIQSALKGERA